LLISSQVYDREQQQKLNADQTAESSANVQVSTLPDEKTLVSYNPIVTLAWAEDSTLYFQTAFVKRMKKEIDSVTSFPRWHRLIFTPQVTVSR